MLSKGELLFLDLSREKKCEFWREYSSPEREEAESNVQNKNLGG